MCIRDRASRIQAAEMRFLRNLAGYTLQDRKRNIYARQELNIICILDRITQYRLKWLKHLNLMDCRMINLGIAASPNNYGIINRNHEEMYIVRRTVGVTSSSLSGSKREKTENDDDE